MHYACIKKFENGEQGNYVDFCSLYPDVFEISEVSDRSS